MFRSLTDTFAANTNFFVDFYSGGAGHKPLSPTSSPTPVHGAPNSISEYTNVYLFFRTPGTVKIRGAPSGHRVNCPGNRWGTVRFRIHLGWCVHQCINLPTTFRLRGSIAIFSGHFPPFTSSFCLLSRITA